MFILFIKDLPLEVSNSALEIYADDTTQVASGSSVSEVESILTEELKKVNGWANENKMVLNQSKTKSMLICSKPKLRKLAGKDLTVSTENGQLECVNEVKLLGIRLDNSLTWDNHLKYIHNKISKRLGLLKRTKKFLSLKARTLFYHSLIQPILDYGAIVWGSTKKQHIDDMVKFQKR
ncbi:predicted protein, partial [Nematostella vectensis]